MPGLGAAQVSLRDFPTGLNVVTFDVDPTSYSPFNVPIRGSSFKVLDGTVIFQDFGLQQNDWTITLHGFITDPSTLKSLWTKYRQGGGGQTFQWNDFYSNQWEVVFTPGVEAFRPVPVIGDNNAFQYDMSLSVISVLSWFGAPY